MRIKTTDLPLDPNGFTLTVDYSKTLEEAIDAGKYDLVNDHINNENFPVSPEIIGEKINISGKLFHFDRQISSNDVIAKMDKEGYRPATLMELLTLGILFPDLQKWFPIIALGSSWLRTINDPHVAVLNFINKKRWLFLANSHAGWRAYSRFFGVKK